MYSMDAEVRYGAAAGTRLANVRDVRWDVEGTEVDESTRDGAGWGSTGVSLRRLNGEIDLKYSPADAGYIVMRDAALPGGDPVRLQFLDSVGGDGVEGMFSVTNMSQPQELEGMLVVTFTVKLHSGAALVGG